LSSLGAAHLGYIYQDSVTAYHLALTLTHKYDAVIVDRKMSEDDRFDDLSVRSGTYLRRCQIKSSRSMEQPLELRFLTTVSGRKLEIDNLVRCFRDAGD